MKTVKKKLSIVIPMFNSEKYIIRTLDNIINTQKLYNYEIIIIDDCSTDFSCEKCSKYIVENNLENVTLIKNLHNKGVSYSRNRGIELAKGDFILFADSDDLYENNAICEMLQNAIPDTLLITGISFEKNRKRIKHIYNEKELISFAEKKDIVKVYNKKLLNSPCNKIFDLHLINKNNIRFDNELSKGEDLKFCLDYICQINIPIIIINKPLHRYLVRKDGNNFRNRENELEIIKYLHVNLLNKCINNFNISLEDYQCIYSNFLFEYIDWCMRNQYNTINGFLIKLLNHNNYLKYEKNLIMILLKKKHYKIIKAIILVRRKINEKKN